MIEYEHNHLKDDVHALLQHIGTARAAEKAGHPDVRDDSLFRAGLRLLRLEQELARMGEVITEMEGSAVAERNTIHEGSGK